MKRNFTIRNNENSFYNLSDFIKNNSNEDLILNFVDDLSKFVEFREDIYVIVNIYFKETKMEPFLIIRKENYTYIFIRERRNCKI